VTSRLVSGLRALGRLIARKISAKMSANPFDRENSGNQ
jgi:hypothetical protein